MRITRVVLGHDANNLIKSDYWHQTSRVLGIRAESLCGAVDLWTADARDERLGVGETCGVYRKHERPSKGQKIIKSYGPM